MEALKQYAVTEISVVYNPKRSRTERPIIQTSADAAIYLMDGFNRNTMAIQEQFVCMYLNRGNRILGIYKASIGGITGTIADPRLIMATALKVGAVSLAICHNHPSGTLKPSRADEELTKKISNAAKFFDIKLLDHLILDHNGGYFSFADEGLL
jgi:DNA repair protein RadC